MYHIAIAGLAPYYTPASAMVTVDYLMQWDNRTATDYTVMHEGCLTGNSCLFDSGAVSLGNRFVLPPLQSGSYRYACRLHPIMRGVVTMIEPPSNQAESETIG